MLATAIGIPHISTGEMLRQNVADATPLGLEAASIMERGDLVPDDIVVAMVAERLGRGDAGCGYLLDGFPRNIAQAAALAAEAGDDALESALLLDVDDDVLIARLLARAGELARADDNEETIRRRLDVYRAETEPLAAWYPEHGVPVLIVEGVGTIGEVFARVAAVLAEVPA
jgi:adenylate kinase